MTTRLAAVLSLHLLLTRAVANLTPTAPGPGETYNARSNCPIQWQVDESGTWTNVSIDLKSGSNDNQTLVKNVVSGLDGTDSSLTPFTWMCPEVDPYSAIYFYQFTNNGDASTAKWTTRFTIASPTDDSVTPANSQQPNGDDTPWGNGQLAGDEADTDGDEADTESIGVNQGDSEDSNDGKNDREDSSGSDSGSDSGDSQSDGDNKAWPKDDSSPASSRHDGTKSTPAAATSSTQTEGSDTEKGDDKTGASDSVTDSPSNSTDATTSAKLEALTMSSKPTKAASQASVTGATFSTAVAHAKAVTLSGVGSATAVNSAKPTSAKPTPSSDLPSSQKARASDAASAASSTPSSTCQCPADEKAGLKMTNGSAEREKISDWILLYPLLVVLLVVY